MCFRHDIITQIASELISEDLKSQIFYEEYAPRPPRQHFTRLNVWAKFPTKAIGTEN